LHKAKDRDYRCSCGYRTHRDRLGAINILSAPVIGGNSLSA
ncbi:MAG: transposase, partial [Peptococcaceae bacterium]|nr:transposase [Peptococcaceae bacterium]MBS3937362.1 transposase [Peptococcaceae bacterium]MBS3937389.1 transposase [Peptococcaceae bacterium]MBS3938261.1 transposase [Peptococcaceae bacterium]MBS3949729.1 transposase [Peptococcaceae bacterium]